MPLRSVFRLAFLFTLLVGFVPAHAADIKVMISAGFFQACLSGFYPHPQHVGCCQAPE